MNVCECVLQALFVRFITAASASAGGSGGSGGSTLAADSGSTEQQKAAAAAVAYADPSRLHAFHHWSPLHLTSHHITPHITCYSAIRSNTAFARPLHSTCSTSQRSTTKHLHLSIPLHCITLTSWSGFVGVLCMSAGVPASYSAPGVTPVCAVTLSTSSAASTIALPLR